MIFSSMVDFLSLQKQELHWEIFWVSLSCGIFYTYQTIYDKAVWYYVALEEICLCGSRHNLRKKVLVMQGGKLTFENLVFF